MHPDHSFLQHRTHAQCGRFSPPISLCSHSNRAGRSLGLEQSRQDIPQSCTWGIVKAWHQQSGKFFNPLLHSSSYFTLFYLFFSANIYLHLQQPIFQPWLKRCWVLHPRLPVRPGHLMRLLQDQQQVRSAVAALQPAAGCGLLQLLALWAVREDVELVHRAWQGGVPVQPGRHDARSRH